MFRSRIKWFFSLSRLGVTHDYDDDVSRRIVFSNVVFISLPIVYVIFMAIDYESYLIPFNKMRFDQFVVPIIIAVCFSGLWMNGKGKTTLSRVLFIILWPALLHLLPIKLLQTPTDYYLAFPFGIVFHSMLIQLMFSFSKEWQIFSLSMMTNIAGLLFFPAILAYYDDDQTLPSGLGNYEYYFLDGILYWLLFNLVTFYVMYIIGSYITRVRGTRELIEEQKEELNALNLHLEELVAKRTSELKIQNEKLRLHAYFNAHLLRGPFCRVKGLIQLQEFNLSQEDEKHEIRGMLHQSVRELDDRIREIQKLVETNDTETILER